MDGVIVGGPVATMTEGGERYGLLPDGAVAFGDGVIQWVGPAAELPSEYSGRPLTDVAGRLVTPALIDCHTHIVFGGDRAGEFEMRLEGASYEAVARAGGGILSTMRATREADEDALLASALPRVDHLIAEGVGTLEVKSGYGLTVAHEAKMLRVARRIGEVRPVRVVTSWLAAHAVPPEIDRAAYLEDVVLAGLAAAHAEGLVDAVDGFCEGIAFSADEMSRVFDRAVALGLPVKLHAEQLSHSGGAALVARYGGLSADHLEFLTDADAAAMGAAGTVAVVLPGAYYTLRQDAAPDIAALRRHRVPIAVATDCNPGSSPLTSLLLAMNMAATLFRLTPEEALAGTTRHAAAALGLGGDIGTLESGKRADLAVWSVRQPAELVYRIGYNPLAQRLIGGVPS
ncbi:imidazolonepropionase [Acuticoccus sp. I52.16.1]|uniref:imidazolonepropionase n=1 Tax=Acuticoccus sp. I52.16.1 TaxID=2928472 RepID=UPI001FD1EC0C|nr:imidazolonepropionase [Acuticoccus sp. I52.16.1]UOM33566.1 imidazolonepropionase [Acuticoccus sp. I52.16.1]